MKTATVVFIQGKAKSNKKMKGDIDISLGSGCSAQSDSRKGCSSGACSFSRGLYPSRHEKEGSCKSIGYFTSKPKRFKPSVVRNSSSLRKIGNAEGMKKYANFKKFDTVMDHSDYFYSNQNSAIKQPPKDWTKKIQEWKILKKGLPGLPTIWKHSIARYVAMRLVLVRCEQVKLAKRTTKTKCISFMTYGA